MGGGWQGREEAAGGIMTGFKEALSQQGPEGKQGKEHLKLEERDPYGEVEENLVTLLPMGE